MPSHQEKISFIQGKCIDGRYDIQDEAIEKAKAVGESELYWPNFLRPIALADVLLALNAKKETSWYWSVNTTGAWIDRREDVMQPLCEWNFYKTLEDQDEPTISFLYDLLK